MISIQNLSFAYNKNNVIFKQFSMHIEDQIFGLIGVNGAGKSTLLKLLVGLLKPNSGFVEINNKNVQVEKNSVNKQIGVLFENPIFPPWTRILDHLLFVAQLRGLNYTEAYSESIDLLKQLDLEDKMESSFDQLSAGLKQRFGIAQSIIGNPKIVFLDEPTANLDALSRTKILKFIKQRSRKYSIQIIIFSHILNDLEKFCDSYAILHKGIIKVQESINELLTKNFYNEFLIRFSDPSEMSKTRQMLKPIGCEVLEESDRELLIMIRSRQLHKEFISLKFPASISVIPAKSLLEQVFLEITNNASDENELQ